MRWNPARPRWRSWSPQPVWRGRPHTVWRLRWSGIVSSCATSTGGSPLGSRFAELAAARRRGSPAHRRRSDAADPCWTAPRESAQIYRRQGDQRVCIAAVERASGLRDSIPVGAMLSMEAGSRRADPARLGRIRSGLHQGLRHAKFNRGPSSPPCASAAGRSRSTNETRACARCPRRFATPPDRSSPPSPSPARTAAWAPHQAAGMHRWSWPPAST